MRIFVILCGLFLFGWGSLFSQQVIVQGQTAGYSGASIQVSLTRNPFIAVPRNTETVICDENGSFKITIEVETERMIQFETGIYRAYLYVEPGIHYRVELPKYQEKAYADQISPFFQPLEVPLNILSRISMGTKPLSPETMDLNYSIARFDSAFSNINDGVILNRRLGKESDVDTIIRTMESEYELDSSLFFEEYRKYKYGVLKLNEGKTGLENISLNYLGPQVRVLHPGFMELFGAMFKEFLFYYSRTPPGKELRNQINRYHSLRRVRQIIGQHPAVWNDTLVDMIILKELSDLFYGGDIHQEAILILLDSMVLNPISPDLAIYAQEVQEKLISLVIGHPPPAFNLPDLEGNLCAPGDFEGQYIYLMFCTPEHYGCMMEYPFLQSFHLKHAAYLQVVTVMVAQDESQVKDFMQRNGYGWKALYYEGQPGILSDYQIKAFPTAYLIGPDGKLVLSPSSLPSDGFEQQLFRIMRSKGEI